MTISSRECVKKWGTLQSWDIIQVSESNSTFKIINGHSRGYLIIDGKVPKSASSADNVEEINTWILNQATMTTTTKTSIGKFSIINCLHSRCLKDFGSVALL